MGVGEGAWGKREGEIHTSLSLQMDLYSLRSIANLRWKYGQNVYPYDNFIILNTVHITVVKIINTPSKGMSHSGMKHLSLLMVFSLNL